MALTPEELRQRIPNWSLESDGNLLQYMISIAKNLEEKCTKTRDNLNSLMLQVDQTELKLSNATNQFSAVEQVKFVENRVEEDDESFYGLRRRRQQQQHLQQQVDEGKESSNHGQDPERSFDDLIQLAVERSIEGMYKSYEKVTLELTDSDTSDGEDTSEGGTRMTEADLSGGKTSIMRAVPRHPFIDRPLPHVIGSREWQNKWHVGLIDSDDESSSERKEEYSESSSQSDDDDDGGMFPSQPNSKNHTPSESESSIWGTDAVARKRAPSMDPSITGDDGSSVYSYASSSKPRALPNSLPVRGMLPIGVSLKHPSLFPEEPPEQVVDDVKKRSDKGLFDESPDEEEEVEPAPMPTPRQTAPNSNATVPFFKGTVNHPARKMVNLFDDQPPSPQQQRGPLMPEPKKPINLFIESDDEEERKENTRNNNNVPDEVVERNVRHSAQPVTNPRTMTKLVDELNNNFRKQSGPTVRNPEQRSSVASNLFDAEPPVDDFEPLFNAAKSPTSQSALPQPAFRTVVEKKTVNLFADDDDDDDDGIVVGSNEKQPVARSPFISPIRVTPSKQPERKKKSIFDESDSDVENDNVRGAGLVVDVQRNQKLPSENSAAKALPQLPKVTTKSIFSDSSEAEEDDEDALFGHSSNVVKSKLDALKRNGASSVPTVAPVSQQRLTKNPPDEKKMAKKSLFDDESEDDTGEDSLFSSKPLVTARISSTAAPTQQKTTQAKVSFDDVSFAEEDRLPVDPNRSSASIAQGTSSKMSTNEDLFESGIKTEAPEVKTNSTESFAVKPSSLEPAHTHAKVISVRKPVEVDPLYEVASEPTVPSISEPPVGGSIRSMILKKSIFNSDSESEEDDSIFGPSKISIGAERASENVFDGLNTKVETEKCDTDGAQLNRGPGEIDERSDVDKLNSKEVEIESIPQPIPPNGIDSRKGEEVKTLPDNLFDDDSTSTANKLDIVDPDVWDSQKTPSPAEVVPKETVSLVPADANKSIFDDSSSESEADPVLNMFAKKIKNDTVFLDQDAETEANSLKRAPADFDAAENEKKIDHSVQPEDLKKSFASEESLEGSQTNERALYGAKNDQHTRGSKHDLPSNSFADEATIPVDCETAPPEDEPSSKQSPLGMIANDIDYFLRTNEPVRSEAEPSRPDTPPAVKSEPKSALNFSPIGLFDDVPPPDDEGDDLDDPNDHVVHQKHFHPGSTLSHADDIPTESQSLNFIPNGGSGSGNGARTRYLFDDEPPPDEADNGASSGFEVDRFPFKGTVGKVSLFENRPLMPDEPVSLPPISQNVDKAQARPKVNKLNAKIAINVAALLPGARRPAPATIGPSITGSVDSPDIAVGEESRPEVTASNAGTNGGKLTGLNKGRARIPTKRKPPSRQTLRAAAVAPTDRDLRKESDPAETDDRIVVGSEQKMLHIEAGEQTKPGTIPPELTEQLQRDAAKLDPLVDRLSASVRKPSATVSRITARPDGHEAVVPIQPAQPKVTSIFGDSSDSENDDDKTTDSFFSKLSSGHGAAAPIGKSAANAVSRPLALGSGMRPATGPSIFGSDDEDDDGDGADDLFGSKKSTIAKHLKASKAGDLSGKPSATKAPTAKASTSLFGDDDSDNDDPDDLFGSKTKSLPKAPGGGNATGRPITSMTTKTATTTRAVRDPLADLLDS